jgi:hypothetical protein
MTPESPRKSFAQNAGDIVRKHGLKIGAGLLLTGNLFMMSHPLWDWEHANVMRDWVACPILSAFNIQLMRDQKESAYDFATIGSPFHVAANVMQNYWPTAVTWVAFGAASFKGSRWGKKLSERSNVMAQFIQNKKDILVRDPHVQAASLRLGLSVIQFVDATNRKDRPMQVLSGAGVLGSLFYMGSAVANHLFTRKPQPQMD